jgi:hypothetical protein
MNLTDHAERIGRLSLAYAGGGKNSMTPRANAVQKIAPQ